MIIRVHAGTRILIRSLGQSCCAEPAVSIAFDGAFQRRITRERTPARGGGVRRRYVGSSSSYLILEEQCSHTWKCRTDNLEEFTDMITGPSRRIRVSRPYCRNISAQGCRSTERTVCGVTSPRLRVRKGLLAPIGEGTMKSGVDRPETASNRHASGFKGVRTYLIHLDIRGSSQM